MSNLFEDLKAPEAPAVQKAARTRRARKPKAPLEPVKPRPWWGISPLKALALAVAVGASAVSVYYSFSWFSSTEPAWLALIQALTITGATTLFPDLALGLWAKGRRWVAVGVVSVGLLASGFSMTNTLGRTYNARTAARVQTVGAQQMERLEAELARVDREAEALTARLAVIPPEYTTQLREVSARLKALQDARIRVLAEVDELARVEGPTSKRQDFYAFVGDAVGVSAESAEFWFSAVGAVFWDIVAPVAAVVAYLL